MALKKKRPIAEWLFSGYLFQRPGSRDQCVVPDSLACDTRPKAEEHRAISPFEGKQASYIGITEGLRFRRRRLAQTTVNQSIKLGRPNPKPSLSPSSLVFHGSESTPSPAPTGGVVGVGRPVRVGNMELAREARSCGDCSITLEQISEIPGGTERDSSWNH
jgi:hypothetical protein